MDPRRNLDGVYKRRFEETQKSRYQLELQLSIVNRYAQIESLSHESQKDQAVSVKLKQLDTLVHEIQTMLASELSSDGTGLSMDDVNECASLSKLELENIPYNTSRIHLSELAPILDPFELIYMSGEQMIHPGCYVLTDRKSMFRVLRAAKLLFPTPGSAALDYDIMTTSLTVRMKDSADHNRLTLLFEQVETIMEKKGYPSLDGSVSTLFVCKALAQSMGGDVTLDGTEIVIEIPGELNCERLVTPQAPPTVPTVPIVPTVPNTSRNHSPVVAPVPTEAPAPTSQSTGVPAPLSDVPLTAAPARKPDIMAAVSDPLKGRNLNILLVEDGPILQDIFKRWWTKKNHNVFIANNGQEAVDMFKKQNFSIVFSDIEIPIKDGFNVTREIRAFEAEKNRRPTPIIGVSGYSTKMYAELAIQSGMNDFVSKGTGFQMNKMYELVVKYCATE